MADKYTITKIDADTGDVSFDMNIKGKTIPQTVSGLPLDDKESLKTAVSEYVRSYRRGLKTTQTVPAGVNTLVGKSENVADETNE